MEVRKDTEQDKRLTKNKEKREDRKDKLSSYGIAGKWYKKMEEELTTKGRSLRPAVVFNFSVRGNKEALTLSRSSDPDGR